MVNIDDQIINDSSGVQRVFYCLSKVIKSQWRHHLAAVTLTYSILILFFITQHVQQ